MFQPEKVRKSEVKEVISRDGNRTIIFQDELCSRGLPGQFVMIDKPGIGEASTSLLRIDGDGLGRVMFKESDEAIRPLLDILVGNTIVIRGPLGIPFQPNQHDRALLVAMDNGIPPVLSLLTSGTVQRNKATIVLAGKTEAEIMMRDEAGSLTKDLHIVPHEDGVASYPRILDHVLTKVDLTDYGDLFISGPSALIFEFLRHEKSPRNFQACILWPMRCGIGICGLCHLGQYLICGHGPVFDRKKLEETMGQYFLKTIKSEGLQKGLKQMLDKIVLYENERDRNRAMTYLEKAEQYLEQDDEIQVLKHLKAALEIAPELELYLSE